MFKAVRAGLEGDHDNGLIFCSSKMDKADRMETVEDVFREFTN